jgi:hypothetical protein
MGWCHFTVAALISALIFLANLQFQRVTAFVPKLITKPIRSSKIAYNLPTFIQQRKEHCIPCNHVSTLLKHATSLSSTFEKSSCRVDFDEIELVEISNECRSFQGLSYLQAAELLQSNGLPLNFAVDIENLPMTLSIVRLHLNESFSKRFHSFLLQNELYRLRDLDRFGLMALLEENHVPFSFSDSEVELRISSAKAMVASLLRGDPPHHAIEALSQYKQQFLDAAIRSYRQIPRSIHPHKGLNLENNHTFASWLTQWTLSQPRIMNMKDCWGFKALRLIAEELRAEVVHLQALANQSISVLTPVLDTKLRDSLHLMAYTFNEMMSHARGCSPLLIMQLILRHLLRYGLSMTSSLSNWAGHGKLSKEEVFFISIAITMLMKGGIKLWVALLLSIKLANIAGKALTSNNKQCERG